MNSRSSDRFTVLQIVLTGVMAALVFAANYVMFPLLSSRVHLSNAFCLLAGMLLGPVPGGLAAGIGAALFDLTAGYDVVGILITFVSKFAMAWVCGALMQLPAKRRGRIDRTFLAAVAGALTYVFLYMLKTYIFQRLVYGYPLDAVGVTMWGKFVPSMLNAAVAVIAAPLIYHAVLPALKHMGVVK